MPKLRAERHLRKPWEAESDEERVRLQFGLNVYLIRSAQKISQEELGRLANMHRTQMTLIENGDRFPRVHTIHRLAAALGVTMDQLFNGIVWTPPDLIDKEAQGSYRFTGPEREA